MTDTTMETTFGFRSPQVCKVVGITYRQLDYWDRTGLLGPSMQEATGSGTQRLYSFQDIVTLRVIKRLKDAGTSLHKIRQAFDQLEEEVGLDPVGLSLQEKFNAASRAYEEAQEALQEGDFSTYARKIEEVGTLLNSE